MSEEPGRRERLLLEAEKLGRTGAWEMDLVTGEVESTAGNRRLFFGDDPDKGANLDDYATAVHPDDREYVMRRREELLAGGGDPEIEFRVIWPNGSVHMLHGYQRVIRDGNGRALRTMGTNADVTERKRAEDALRGMQEQLVATDRVMTIGTMAAGIAHEINNPLAYALSNIEFALDQLAASTGASPELRTALDEARQGTERVRVIVRDLKTFSRPDEETVAPVDVRTIVESSLHMASNVIEARARVVRAYGEVPTVVANEARLGQVFLNLILNAAQAIPDGAPAEHEIRVATSTDAGGRAIVTVRDTGSGMTEEVRARIFEPFFTTKPVGEGTGLGLSISQRIIAGLGGEITVDSAVGRGTEFRVALPAARAVVAAKPVVAPAGTVRRGKILVIDDERLIRASIMRTLQPTHAVTAVAGGHEALEVLARGERFDVILCDLMMPDMSGMKLYDRLVELDAELARRVVFLTGGAFTPAARELLARVPNRTIEKPFGGAELRAIVQQQLATIY